MTIKEYYANYKTNKKLGITLPCGTADTIEEFYNKCISKNMLPKENVLAWHDMFIEYIQRKDAVFWVRYYESGNKKSGRWNTRRGCKTQFNDGFSYVFVSNFDAHEIFNMVRLGVKPDVEEFLQLMKNYEFPLHYDDGESCEEKDMAVFPKIGSTRAGVLTPDHWYLAHIVGIKEDFIGVNGAILNVDVDKIYPRGEVIEWKHNSNGKKVRKIDYNLTESEKELVKAHFLRFIDPLNYYAAPGRDWQSNDVAYIIGEAKELNDFMSEQYKKNYGAKKMFEFRKYALATCDLKGNGNMVINVTFGKKISGTTKPKKSASTKMIKKRVGVPNITFTPADIEMFKKELLIKKKAEETWEYSDGTKIVKIWNAKKLTRSSNILTNIQSKTEWREKDIKGLVKVSFRIL